MSFSIKRNDTSPAIEYQLQDADGNAVDITGYTDVRYLMTPSGSDTLTVDDDTAGNVSVTDASAGKVKYEWQAADTDTPGYYEAEWEVEYSDGTKETFPNSDYIYVIITTDKG